MVAYYMNNARVIREGLQAAGLTVYGGVNSPYVWAKTPNGTPSWDFFDKLLREANVVTTPRAGFGPVGGVLATASGAAASLAGAPPGVLLVGCDGIGGGKAGEVFIGLTGLGDAEKTREAVSRVQAVLK